MFTITHQKRIEIALVLMSILSVLTCVIGAAL